MKKDLKEKAISIKGKKYVQVSDRVIFFNENYKEGCIITKLLTQPLDTTIVIKALVYPEGKEGRYFTGHAQEVIGDGYINKTSAMENAETSAIGRALAMMGIGVLDSIASVDEITKAENRATKSDLVCDICGTQGAISYKRNKNGTPYCPNWKKHKEDGVKNTMIPPQDYNEKKPENVIDFETNMPAEK